MPMTADLRAVGEFAAARHGVFNLKQAALFDITTDHIARMIRDGTIRRVHRGVFAFGPSPRGWRQDAYAATLAANVVAAAGTCAALHGLDGHPLPPAQPEVLCLRSVSARLHDVTVRHTRALDGVDLTIVDHVPCTTIARTIIDLAAWLDRDGIVRMIDDAQRRGCSMHWLLQRAVDLQHMGRPGPTTVIEIVRARLDGYRVPDSWFERLLERCLASPVLDGVVRQHELRDSTGQFVARFDLAVPSVRLGIEAHSRGFHVGEMLERYDAGRDLRCAQQGWDIAYLGFAATRSPREVCADIERLVLRRSADLGLPGVRAG